MAKVKIQGHASGTGVLTVTAPNTSTDRTITLPDSTGTLLTADGDGSSLTGVGVDGISSSADATAITIDSSERVGIGAAPASGIALTISKDGTGADLAGIRLIDSNSGNDQQIYNYQGNLYFRDSTAGVTRLRVDADGLKFGNDTAAANALDDYEEGTYAAVISGSTSGTFNMDSNDTLAYTKVGRIVSVQGYVGVSSGSVSGNLRITLPFTPTSLPDDAQYNFSSLYIANTGNTNSGQKYLFLTGDAYGWFYKVEDSGSAGYMHQGDVDSAFQVAVSFTYISG